MNKVFLKNFYLITFFCIPIIFLWHPNWLGFSGIQPYWPLFWLLPWSMIYGSFSGLVFGLFLGLILDSITVGNSYTQIIGLVLCAAWFGRINTYHENVFVGHLRYGLICSIGSFMCSTVYFLQILIKNSSGSDLFLYYANFKNILAEVLLTGLLAPFFCSHLLKIFKFSREKKFS